MLKDVHRQLQAGVGVATFSHVALGMHLVG